MVPYIFKNKGSTHYLYLSLRANSWARLRPARKSAVMVAAPAIFNAKQRARLIADGHSASQPAGARASRDAHSLLHVVGHTTTYNTCSNIMRRLSALHPKPSSTTRLNKREKI